MNLKMSSEKPWPFHLGLNVLTDNVFINSWNHHMNSLDIISNPGAITIGYQIIPANIFV